MLEATAAPTRTNIEVWGTGAEYALRVGTYDIFISYVCEFFGPCHHGGGFFFGFTGPLFQVLHYEEARAAPQIYVRICTCAPIRTPRRIPCNMNKHTCISNPADMSGLWITRLP